MGSVKATAAFIVALTLPIPPSPCRPLNITVHLAWNDLDGQMALTVQ